MGGIELEFDLSQTLIDEGITRIERIIDSRGIPVVIVNYNNQTIQFVVQQDPFLTSKSCEMACKDYLSHNLVSALAKLITDNWDKIKPEESSTDNSNEEISEESEKKPRISYRVKYTDEKNNVIAESVLIEGNFWYLLTVSSKLNIE
jgi:hypothetical protein